MWAEVLTFAASVEVVLVASAAVLIVARIVLGPPAPLLPPIRERAVTWTGGGVIAAIALAQLFWPVVMTLAFTGSGLYRLIHNLAGGDFDQNLMPKDSSQYQSHLIPWIGFLSFPLAILSILLLFEYPRRFRLYQLGFTKARLWQMIVLGWLGWLVFAIPVDILYIGIDTVFQKFLHQPHEVHDIAKLALDRHPPLLPLEWVVLVLGAAVIAPFLEEVIYRGILLRWLNFRPQRTWIVLFIAVFLTWATRASKEAPRSDDWSHTIFLLAPLGFVVPITVFVALLPRLPFRPEAIARWQAILASSLLFAVAHAAYWPSPIALFVFATGLGWMACRTQSVVPCIITHGLFNAVACVEMLLS
jgi:membrane protease YdiL (CAAX protease family)